MKEANAADLLGGATDLQSRSAVVSDMGQASAKDLRSGGCDPVAQTGCDTNEKCLPDGDSGSCQSVSFPESGLGSECAVDSGDTCVAGEICLKETESTAFVCHQLCRVSNDCTGTTLSGAPAPACDLPIPGSTSRACSSSCNPVGAVTGGAGCQSGLTCAIEVEPFDSQTTIFTVECVTPGSGAIGASCLEAGDCIPGALCASGMCQKACHLGGQGECGSQSCVGFGGLGKPSPFGACG